MKKLILITALMLVALTGFSQTTTRVSSETLGFWTVTADTMVILKTDNVIAGSVFVPSYATDSVTVSGCTFTIDGIATNGIKIPPGAATVNFGFKMALMDTLSIVCPNEGWVVLLIDRN